MIKNITTALLLFIAIAATAQVPGYQGLKFSVKYDCGIMHPAIVGRPGTLPMLYHNGSVDYVISRKFSVGVKYGFMFYKAPPDRAVFGNDVNYYETDGGVRREEAKGKYVQHTVAIVFKHFMRRRGFIAPAGRYFTYGIYYQNVTNRFKSLELDYNQATSEYDATLIGKKADSHTVGIMLGTGRNFIVANRMIIDIGANLNVSPYIFRPDQDDGFMDFAQRELILRNLLQVYLGIGFLAF